MKFQRILLYKSMDTVAIILCAVLVFLDDESLEDFSLSPPEY